MTAPGGPGKRRSLPARGGVLRTLLAAGAGAATVFGFAPFGAALVPIVTLTLLFLLWQDAATPRAAAWSGFAFGFALFGAGVSWIAIALSTFGGMPWIAALFAVAVLCAFLALYIAAAGWLAARWTAPRSWQRALAAAGAWTLAEWVRSVALTGFGWLSLGYSQLPDGGVAPLAPYATLGGVFAVSLVVALSAGALALAIDAFAGASVRRGLAWLAGIAALAAGGMALRSHRMDRAGGLSGRRLAAAGQRRAAPQVRPGFPRCHLRALRDTRERESRPPHRAARERVPDVRR